MVWSAIKKTSAEGSPQVRSEATMCAVMSAPQWLANGGALKGYAAVAVPCMEPGMVVGTDSRLAWDWRSEEQTPGVPPQQGGWLAVN